MSIKCRFSKLIIPNDVLHAKATGKYIAEIAKEFGFDDRDIQAIDTGVNDATRAIIDYSFEPGEQTNLEVSCELIATGLKVTIKDKGLPWGETLPESGENADATDGTSKFGQQVFQLQMYMDEVSLHNRGHQGKEIVLIKHLSSKTITDYYAECELEPYELSRPENNTDAEVHQYVVRQMKPSEAVEVSKTVYKAYGYSYAREYMYFPEKINALNESGEIHSAVVVTGDNRIAGHCALQFWEENPRIAELAAGVVKPEFRSRGYFAELTEYLINEAQNKDLLGVFVHTVTNHTISQRTGHRVGLQDCAIRLGLVPTTMSFKGFSDEIHQKLSILIQFRYMNIPSELTLYLPDSHRPIVTAIYENLGVTPEFSNKSVTPMPDHRSKFKIQVVGTLKFARITMESYGRNAAREIKAELKELCYKKIEAVSLYLNLFDPLTAVMTEKFEELGFFFAGVMPGGLAGGDALILQYLNNVPIDYDQINISSDIARRILSHIKKHDPNFA
jgi:serine/threonine-protein kinase RsbW